MIVQNDQIRIKWRENTIMIAEFLPEEPPL